MKGFKFHYPWLLRRIVHRSLTLFLCLMLSACAMLSSEQSPVIPLGDSSPLYLIGPGDNIRVFVWGNSELSATVPVRPDGRITTPLIEDVQASGITSTQLARKMENLLTKYIKNPVVTVIVTGFQGRYDELIRVVGEATKPMAISYRENITLLDLMIEVGGMTEFASGNRASIVRTINGKQHQFRVRLNDLIKDGDISANVQVFPGDILIIPEAWF